MQLDVRNTGILLGAAMLIGALWAPWYVVDMGAVRDALGGVNSPQVPQVIGQFVREIAAALPDKINADAWQAFERGDVIMLVAGLAAGFAALFDRHEVATFCGAVAAGAVVLAMLNKPGNVPDKVISLSWGPWLALAGAAVIVASSRMGASEEPDSAPTEVDWFARSELTEQVRASGAPSEAWAPPASSVPPPN